MSQGRSKSQTLDLYDAVGCRDVSAAVRAFRRRLPPLPSLVRGGLPPRSPLAWSGSASTSARSGPR